MNATAARAIAWTLVAVTTIAVVADTVITASYQSLLAEHTWAVHGWPLATAASLGWSVVAALILSRYPRHPIGWLLCVPGLASVSLAAESYSFWVLDHDGPGPETAGHVAAWISLLTGGQVAIAALSLIFLLSPDGHLPSRRWRWAAWTTVLGVACFLAGLFMLPPTEFDLSESEDVGQLSGLLGLAGFLLIGVGLVASAVSIVLRVRRARDDARRQLLWVAGSAGFLAAGFVFYVAVQAAQGGEQTLLAATPLFTAFLSFPICIGIAVLRHRLFDIDLIVNRALVVAIATGLVAAGYVLLVVGIGAAVGEGTGAAVGEGTGGFWASLLALAVVALAFQPVRRRVVRMADRLAFGAAAAPYEALSDFSRRLGDSPDPSALLPAVADAAGTAVNAARATVRLSVPGCPDRVATWSPGVVGAGVVDLPGVDLPVVDRGEALGSLSVEMPAGRALRAQDRSLLQDLADQASIAFRNARLSAELAAKVEQLTEGTRALAESRRRLITAGDVARSRLERAIARDVVPHLEPLPARLDGLARDEQQQLDGARLQPLIASSAAALEALREITRGVFPAQLTRSGLEPALSSLLTRTGTGRLAVGESAAGRRMDPRVEAAAYFCVVEAVRDLAPPLEVALTAPGELVVLVISGCDRGPLTVAGMRDRVETVGGTVTSRSAEGRTVLQVRMPARSPADVMT